MDEQTFALEEGCSVEISHLGLVFRLRASCGPTNWEEVDSYTEVETVLRSLDCICSCASNLIRLFDQNLYHYQENVVGFDYFHWGRYLQQLLFVSKTLNCYRACCHPKQSFPTLTVARSTELREHICPIFQEPIKTGLSYLFMHNIFVQSAYDRRIFLRSQQPLIVPPSFYQSKATSLPCCVCESINDVLKWKFHFK